MGEIVDFHLGAFDTKVAIAYGYDTHDTPRTPVAMLYTEHRAHTSWTDVEAHRIPFGDVRLRTLGLTSIQHALNDQDRLAAGISGPVQIARRVVRV